MTKPLQWAARVAAVAILVGLVGCSEAVVVEISESRELAPDEREPRLNVSSRERFRFAGFGDEPSGQDSAGESGEPGEGDPRLVWDTPEGWTEKPGGMMRDVNFAIGPEGEAECYIARLPGAGGGLSANVNRWRTQMGLEPAPEEEIAALPSRTLFDRDATFVSLDGSFKGMGATEALDDYRMIGLILSTPNGALFVKMTGPRELVMEEEANFDAFCQSLRIEIGGEKAN